jgi:hypothetical protein
MYIHNLCALHFLCYLLSRLDVNSATRGDKSVWQPSIRQLQMEKKDHTWPSFVAWNRALVNQFLVAGKKEKKGKRPESIIAMMYDN